MAQDLCQWSNVLVVNRGVTIGRSPAVRAWLDGRGEWGWAMDRAFAADWTERKVSPAPDSVAVQIETALASESARVRRAAKRALGSAGRSI